MERGDLIAALCASLSHYGQKTYYFLPYETPVKIKTEFSYSFLDHIFCAVQNIERMAFVWDCLRLDSVRLEEKIAKLFWINQAHVCLKDAKGYSFFFCLAAPQKLEIKIKDI